MSKWVCSVCGYEHDSEPAEDFKCPLCGLGKDVFEEVKEYVIEAQKASTSLLQRRFGIGYNRAARMIDVLEQNGIIGPAQGSKPREVYIKKDE